MRRGAEIESEVVVDGQAVPPGARSVERGGQRMIVSGGIADGDLDDAAAYFERKKRGRGPAQDMADFAKPLMEFADTPEKMEMVFSLGAVFWNLALIKDESERRKAFDEIIGKLTLPEAERESLWPIAVKMVERHREMFPDMHE